MPFLKEHPLANQQKGHEKSQQSKQVEAGEGEVFG
jgi:hypothetical protein